MNKTEGKGKLKVKRFLEGIFLVSLLVLGGFSDVFAKEYTVDSVNLQFSLDDNWIEHKGEKKPTYSEQNSNHIMMIDVVPSPNEKFQEFSQLGSDEDMQSFANSFIEAKKSANKKLKVLNYKVIPFAKTRAILSENVIEGKNKGYARSVYTVHDGKSVSVTFITFTEGTFDSFKGSAMKVLNSMTFTDLSGENKKIKADTKMGEMNSKSGYKEEEKAKNEDDIRTKSLIYGYALAIIKVAGLILFFYGGKKIYKSLKKNNDEK